MQAAFVCVQNAGRSQMAAAYAEQVVERRGLADSADIISGGTRPADAIHDTVVTVMKEDDIDLSGRVPREITPESLTNCEYVITMGCSATDVCPAVWRGESRDWDLDDPHGADEAAVRAIRDEIKQRVTDLFDEVEP